MRRILIGVLAVVLLCIGGFLAGPYYTLWRLVQAARAHDTKVVAQLVDLPAVRTSLKPQLATALQGQLERQKPKPTNLLEQIGAALAPTLIGNAVDSVITPDGVAVMLRTAHAPHPDSAFAHAPPPGQDETGVGDPKLVDEGYNGVLFDWTHKRILDFDLDQFHASVISRSHPENRVNLILLRHGIWDWRVEALDIPALSSGA